MVDSGSIRTDTYPMRQDYWTNTKTKTDLGVTGPLGSPRGWLRRAFDTPSLDDYAFAKDAITPNKISVAAVFYRPARLPANSYPALYRYWPIPTPEHIQGRGLHAADRPTANAIGIALCVPVHDILNQLKIYEEAGASYIWWKSPSDKDIIRLEDKPKRKQLDHARVYELLDSGLTSAEIGKLLGFPSNNILYVKKKWSEGQPLKPRAGYANQAALLEDYKSGIPVHELALRYNKSLAYIYKFVKRNG